MPAARSKDPRHERWGCIASLSQQGFLGCRVCPHLPGVINDRVHSLQLCPWGAQSPGAVASIACHRSRSQPGQELCKSCRARPKTQGAPCQHPAWAASTPKPLHSSLPGMLGALCDMGIHGCMAMLRAQQARGDHSRLFSMMVKLDFGSSGQRWALPDWKPVLPSPQTGTNPFPLTLLRRTPTPDKQARGGQHCYATLGATLPRHSERTDTKPCAYRVPPSKPLTVPREGDTLILPGPCTTTAISVPFHPQTSASEQESSASHAGGMGGTRCPSPPARGGHTECFHQSP